MTSAPLLRRGAENANAAVARVWWLNKFEEEIRRVKEEVERLKRNPYLFA